MMWRRGRWVMEVSCVDEDEMLMCGQRAEDVGDALRDAGFI